MASIASASPSSHSFRGAESGDDSESWQYIDSNAASSVAFFPSPASGSLQSWGAVGYVNPSLGAHPSPPAVSPLQLDLDHQNDNSVSMSDQPDLSMMAAHGFEAEFLGLTAESQGYATEPDSLLFNDQLFNNDNFLDMPDYYNPVPNNGGGLTSLGLGGLDMPSQPGDLDIPSQFRNDSDMAPWGPTNLNYGGPSIMVNEFHMTEPPRPSVPSPGSSGYLSSSPKSSSGKPESEKAPSPIRKIKSNGTSKVEKKKKQAEPASKFFVMTPNSIHASAGKPNPFECFDAMRTTHRGRKGPLANHTKEGALIVRRIGACFCCHNFIRGHFKKEEMSKFMNENIQRFTKDAYQVELFSGPRFRSTLTLRSTFFQPKGTETLTHWHMNVGVNQLDLQKREAAPIGIDLSNTSLRDELRRKTREYVQALTFEPQYAEQVTDSLRHTELPRKILKIVQRYAQRSDSAMVRKALSIMSMHYVMTRHLCLTKSSIIGLQNTGLVIPTGPWVTPRVLNRQIKSFIDDLLPKEVDNLFENFNKSLKAKSQKEWAPCLASFLVLCMFMEAIETAADTFVISQNEIDIRSRLKPQYHRNFALQLNKEIENMPFKQFAYQFHQIYQTHTRDASTRAFNPLLDESFALQGELDAAALEMVSDLKELLQGDSYQELDFLCADPILPNQENHPFPRDTSFNYTGRLLARFMLSFLEERYLFDGQY